MWIPKTIYDLFTFSAEQKAELAKLRIENDFLVRENAEAKANFKWSLTRVNALELERQVLIEKVYNVKVAAPQILNQPNTIPSFNEDIFTDLDELASKSATIESNLPKWGN